MGDYLIRNAKVVTDGRIIEANVLIKGERIERIDPGFDVKHKITEIDAQGKHLMPGVIDDQVHFREPGLTHKANIHSEARAAVAGGTTSFMEMPNVKPETLTQQLLEEKYEIAGRTSLANHSFYMGVSNDNYEEVMKTPLNNVCGIKIFMGSSTGNMLVDRPDVLQKIFANTPHLIATHCEHEATIKARKEQYEREYGDRLNASFHPLIRNEEACYLSSSFAVQLAKQNNTRLHVLHISTAKELELFTNTIDLKNKRITSEACVHHLWFDADDYDRWGNLIKCNPAIKAKENKAAILAALLDNRIDVIATDHAPHTKEEKALPYKDAPAGLPLVQHSLNMMLDFYHDGKISLERIAEKMSHAVAECFLIKDRGYIREGYFADLALLDINKTWVVKEDNIYYKCGWSPMDGYEFKGTVEKTFVSGHLAYDNGTFDESIKGKRLLFNK